MGQFAVIGLGRFGMAASLELVRQGNSVVGVDSDQTLVNAAADKLTLVALADARDEDSLRELNIAEFDSVLVAIGESLESSLLCVLMLKSLGVKDIWVKAMNKPHHIILSKLGVSRIIHPEQEMGVRVAQSLNNPIVNQYMSLGHNLYIVEIEINESCHQKTIESLLKKVADEIHPIMVRRQEELFKNIDGDFLLETDDSLILSGSLTSLEKIASKFLGE